MEGNIRERGAPVVRPLNPNFAFLALKAAVELDEIIHGRSSGQAPALAALARSLLETTTEISGPPSFTCLADPVSADLLNRALEQSSAQPINTVSSLVRRAKDLAESLETATPSSEPSNLEALRNFCLALSQVSSSYLQEERERMRPQHPQRR
jgi:hypothetical protein